MLTVAVDVDEVVAALLPEWLRRYNEEYGDNLTVDELDRWELDECVRPECGKDIFKYLRDPDLYRYVQPIPGARPAIYKMLAWGIRVIYVTSCPVGTVELKRDWLLRYGFLTPANALRDFCPVSDKSLIRADYLFDDRPENVAAFPGYGVLVRQPYNKNVEHRFRAIDSLAEAPRLIRRQALAA